MSAENFQLVADSKIDDSIIKRDFIKRYHQHGAEVNDENQNIKFYFGENLNYIQIGNSYLEIGIEVKKADGIKSDWLTTSEHMFFKKDDYVQVLERK